MQFSSIDIFCLVIDNFGDAGTVYRFATELKRVRPDCRIRIFIDRLQALCAIDDMLSPTDFLQEHGGIHYIDSARFSEEHLGPFGFADVLVETYACRIPDWYMEKAVFNCPLIINLEYLSAEAWVEGYHRKESLLPKGTAKKFFFMPGFTTATGGVLFNSGLPSERNVIVGNRHAFIASLLRQTGSELPQIESMLAGSVFTYERGFDALLRDCTLIERKVLLLCFGAKTHSSMRHALSRTGISQPASPVQQYKNISIAMLPFITQPAYDQLLYCTDFNIVRGEDSWVQAIAAQKPFIWNAYIQDNNYQQVKVDAFCSAFRSYFENETVYSLYRDLMFQFNDAADERPEQTTAENFTPFFRNLAIIEKAVSRMYFFMNKHCNLMEKFCDFIIDFKQQ